MHQVPLAISLVEEGVTTHPNQALLKGVVQRNDVLSLQGEGADTLLFPF